MLARFEVLATEKSALLCAYNLKLLDFMSREVLNRNASTSFLIAFFCKKREKADSCYSPVGLFSATPGRGLECEKIPTQRGPGLLETRVGHAGRRSRKGHPVSRGRLGMA